MFSWWLDLDLVATVFFGRFGFFRRHVSWCSNWVQKWVFVGFGFYHLVPDCYHLSEVWHLVIRYSWWRWDIFLSLVPILRWRRREVDLHGFVMGLSDLFKECACGLRWFWKRVVYDRWFLLIGRKIIILHFYVDHGARHGVWLHECLIRDTHHIYNFGRGTVLDWIIVCIGVIVIFESVQVDSVDLLLVGF